MRYEYLPGLIVVHLISSFRKYQIMEVTFREVVYSNSKSLCDCLIKKGMNLEQAFEVVCKLIKCISKDVDLSQVKIKALNLEEKCELETNMLTAILNALIAADASILLTVNGF